MPDYLSLIWYSIAITAVLCVAMSVYVIVYFVPNELKDSAAEVVRIRATLQGARFYTKLVAWFGFTISKALVILGICALAVSFAGICAAAIHSILNFLARAVYAGLSTLIQEELRSGTLPLRLAGVSVLMAWLWMIRAHFKRMPKAYQLADYTGGDQDNFDRIMKLWEINYNNQRTLFETDNCTRHELKKLPFRMPPATIFFYHALHIGLISLAIAFTWILLAEESKDFGLKGLAWLSLFAAHDVGLIFGYVYLMKGRMLALHRLRIYGSAIGLSALMLIVSQQYILPLHINFGLALGLLSILATLLLIGIAIFEFLATRLAELTSYPSKLNEAG